MQLKVKDLSFKYNPKGKYILKDLNFSIRQGENIAIIAPSGYGKSTFGKLISGYLLPTYGKILLDNNTISNKGIYPVQLIHQHPEKSINPLWKMNSILDESNISNKNFINLLGIKKEWLTRYPNELSGGELQRFCILRVLTSNTKFIVADEISSMLDTITQAQIWNSLLEITKNLNIGLITITHNIELAKKTCDHIIYLDKINQI